MDYYNLFAVAVFVMFLIVYGNWKKNPVVPGPFPLPVIGSAYVLLGYASSKRILLRWYELVKKYNGWVSIWVGPEEQVIITKPEHAQVFFTNHLLLDHAPLYKYFKPALGNGLFLANGADWKAKRKAWNPSFHPSVLRHFLKIFQEHTDILVEVIGKETSEFPAFPYLRDGYMDCIFATQMQYNQNSQRVPNIINDMAEPLNEILFSRVLNLHTQIDAIFKITPSGKRCAYIMKMVYEFLDDVIRTKKKELADEGELHPDDWRNNLFVRQLFNERNATKKEIYDEILTLAVTGYETVARATGFVLLMLGKYQDVQEKVFQEDQEIHQRLNGREMVLDDLQDYQYLERVIKETLRIFPVGPVISRMATEDMNIAGDFPITKGTTVVCFVFAIHRNPEIYPNPLQFNPDNFLPERIAERHPFSYIPYSSGPRGCIGVKYSMIAMKILLSTLIRNYRVFSNKSVEDIDLKVEVTMTDDAGFVIRLEKRK